MYFVWDINCYTLDGKISPKCEDCLIVGLQCTLHLMQCTVHYFNAMHCTFNAMHCTWVIKLWKFMVKIKKMRTPCGTLSCMRNNEEHQHKLNVQFKNQNDSSVLIQIEIYYYPWYNLSLSTHSYDCGGISLPLVFSEYFVGC